MVRWGEVGWPIHLLIADYPQPSGWYKFTAGLTSKQTATSNEIKQSWKLETGPVRL